MAFRKIEVGDYAPYSVFVDQDGQPASLVELPYAGSYTGVAVLRDMRHPATGTFLTALNGAVPNFAAVGAKLVVSACMPVADLMNFWKDLAPGFPMLADSGGECLEAFGLGMDGGGGMIVILDRNSHVIAKLSGLPGVAPTAEALEVIARHANNEAAGMAPYHAPILLIPRLFEPELCRDLVNFWETGEKRHDEVTQGRGSEVRDNILSDVKKRADVLVPEGDNPLHQAVLSRFNMRVVPQIEKVFQYKTTSYDGARIGCYEAGEGDDDNGYFRAHRDSVSHKVDRERRFALSVNLNDGFEGGTLRFNEYGPLSYCPTAGEGVVFSCRLLHEAMPVTKGRRFGVFAFFY